MGHNIVDYFRERNIDFYHNCFPASSLQLIRWDPVDERLYFWPRLSFFDHMVDSHAKFLFVQKFAELMSTCDTGFYVMSVCFANHEDDVLADFPLEICPYSEISDTSVSLK